MTSKRKKSLIRRAIAPFQLSLTLFKSTPPTTLSKKRYESDPTLLEIWKKLIEQYFPERADLYDYEVIWSKRGQRRILASCNIRRKRVLVARELSYTDWAEWLEPLLYHELCHAVLSDTIADKNGKRRWHGQQFRQLEQRHPAIPSLDRWIKQGGWRKAVRSDRARRRVS